MDNLFLILFAHIITILLLFEHYYFYIHRYIAFNIEDYSEELSFNIEEKNLKSQVSFQNT